MHGLINYGLQNFATRVFGHALWLDVCSAARLPSEEFETMLIYEDWMTDAVIREIAEKTNNTRESMLEDFGTFLVSEHSSPMVLRLLQLGGARFEEFLEALPNVYEHLKIAIPELEMPLMHLEENGEGDYGVHFISPRDGYGEVCLGLLRAMADQYGVLVTVSLKKERQENEVLNMLKIRIFDTREATQ